MTTDLPARLRAHVANRGGMAKDADGNTVLPNGAWSMMLEAAETLERVVEQARRDREYCAAQTGSDVALVNPGVDAAVRPRHGPRCQCQPYQ